MTLTTCDRESCDRKAQFHIEITEGALAGRDFDACSLKHGLEHHWDLQDEVEQS